MQKRGEHIMKVISILNLGFMIFMFRSKSSIFQFLIALKRVVSLEKLKTHNSVHLTIFSKSVAGAPIVDQLQDASFTETC